MALKICLVILNFTDKPIKKLKNVDNTLTLIIFSIVNECF